MLLSSLLPADTPAWLSLAAEVGVLLLLAHILLRTLRRGRIVPLAVVAAVWMWFFWPAGHLWMLDASRAVLADARGLVPALLGQAKVAASHSGRALAAAARAHSVAASSAVGGGIGT